MLKRVNAGCGSLTIISLRSLKNKVELFWAELETSHRKTQDMQKADFTMDHEPRLDYKVCIFYETMRPTDGEKK